ncbi:MAG: hypothetical protein KA712_16835 [Myxococcales bacterium]|nr:hypothetical protein [Myxococcales bacterium]
MRFANGLPAGHGAPPSPREQLKALELILFYAVGKPIQPLALDAELDTTQANRLLDSLQNKTTERLTSRLTELLALARQRRGEPDEAIDVAEVPALPGGTEGEP